MRSATRALWLGLCLTTGCAASVNQGQNDGAVSPDATPDGTPTNPTATPTSTPTVMPTSVPTAMPTMTPPTPATCRRTSGSVQIWVTQAGVTRGPCEGLLPGSPSEPMEVRGNVVRVTSRELFVDTCPPNADCIPQITVFGITVGGVGVDAYVHQGEFVTVRLAQSQNYRCTQVIHVRQLPEWGGEANPAGPGRRLRFAASEGFTGLAMSGEMELSVNPRLACPAPPGGPRSCGPVEPGEYDLVFLPINGTPEVVIPMGSSREFQLGTGAEQQTVRGSNLRSYETGACDDYWNYSWWVGAVR